MRSFLRGAILVSQGSAKIFTFARERRGTNEANAITREVARRGFGNERGLSVPSLLQRRDLGAVNLPEHAILVERTHNHVLGGNRDIPRF